MTIKGLLVWVMRNVKLRDCTREGLTSRIDSCLLIDERVKDWGALGAKEGDEVLMVDYRQGYSHPCLTPVAVPAVIRDGVVVQHPGWHQFGGNFINSQDSRFTKIHGDVLPVHDRFEAEPLSRPGGPGWVKFRDLQPGEKFLFKRDRISIIAMKIEKQMVAAPREAPINAITHDGKPFYVLPQDLVLRQASF